MPALVRADLPLLGVIALGGGVGSLVRYGLSTGWPDRAEPAWTTLAINVTGSLLLGMLVVAVTEIWRPHRLLRPLLGTGVLGGFTTFSTFALQLRSNLDLTGVLYLLLSVLGGLAAASAGMILVRRLEPRLTASGSHGAGTIHSGTDPLDPDLP